MTRITLAALLIVVALVAGAQEPGRRGVAKVEETRPKRFPHRIWAACDFERPLPDYAWFGPAEMKDIVDYPGNKTALGVKEQPYKKFAGLMTGINPVPGPMMGTENFLYLRYKLTGADQATFQHYSLTSNDNNHLRLSGLENGKWAEATMNFSKHGRRNDGTPGVPFKKGERMDDLKIFVGQAKEAAKYSLVVDDIIFFAMEPDLPPEPEPFPRRVMYVAGFDTGAGAKARDKYWPGSFDIVGKEAPAGRYWNAARAVPQKKGKGKWIRLIIKPHIRVGAHTKLRFRYHLKGASKMTVQMFDVTDGDNRHIRLTDLPEGKWQTKYLDFTKDAKRNDGNNTPFAAGHEIDDIFFFVEPAGDKPVELFVDEVVLFDAAE